ncbi:hypothetical protein NUW58_g2218 [Xylaria curta]|uniref:Uncharacterized protein n=1 Tax=Xylaria curta TaxID=42375 RepID=A0ACC1PGS7_9PEZI|nr:hypothetical protein NUW58_g2218 [Xylaria curta]
MLLSNFYSLPPDQQQAILNEPSRTAPDGQTSQLINPPNNNVLAYAIVSIVFALASIAFMTRIYVRFILFKQYKFLGDWLLIFSYCFLVANIVTVYYLLRDHGAFVHQWNVTVGDFIHFRRSVFISSQLSTAVILSVKTAILLEWIRIFVPPGSRDFVYWASHFMIFAVLVYYIAVEIALYVACIPLDANWDQFLNGDCTRVDMQIANLSVPVFSLVSDILILLIPQRVIWKLNMSTQKKIGVSVIFAVGLFACIASLIRLVETARNGDWPDFTYTFSGFMLAGAAEISLQFMVIGGPYFPKLFSSINVTKWKPKMKQSSRKQHQSEPPWPRSSYSKMEYRAKRYSAIDSIQLRILPPAYIQGACAKSRGAIMEMISFSQRKPASYKLLGLKRLRAARRMLGGVRRVKVLTRETRKLWLVIARLPVSFRPGLALAMIYRWLREPYLTSKWRTNPAKREILALSEVIFVSDIRS